MSVKIYYDEGGLRDIMKGQSIQKLEQDIMMQKLDEIKASFLQSFGFEGEFETKVVMTNSKRSRASYRIVPSDKKTTAVLKAHPGWMSQFL